MLGSYFQTQELQAIGDDSAPAGNVEAARSMLELFPNLSGNRYTVWGTQVGEAKWIDRKKDRDYLAVPVRPRQLEEAENLAGGHGVGYVAIACTKPVALVDAEAAFRGTPYEAANSLVVYRQDDTKPVPTPCYFIIGRLRDQGERPGKYSQLEVNAKRLGGQLMFLYHVPPLKAPRLRPPFEVNSVVGMSQSQQVYLPHSTRKSEMETRMKPMGQIDPVTKWGALGALAAIGAWYLVKGKR